MKTMKFKVDKVHCEICSTIFKVNKYKTKLPMELAKGRAIPKKQLPKHQCK